MGARGLLAPYLGNLEVDPLCRLVEETRGEFDQRRSDFDTIAWPNEDGGRERRDHRGVVDDSCDRDSVGTRGRCGEAGDVEEERGATDEHDDAEGARANGVEDPIAGTNELFSRKVLHRTYVQFFV